MVVGGFGGGGVVDFEFDGVVYLGYGFVGWIEGVYVVVVSDVVIEG